MRANLVVRWAEPLGVGRPALAPWRLARIETTPVWMLGSAPDPGSAEAELTVALSSLPAGEQGDGG